jgi:SWI/SNF-related matrix-associated actin-dependent regulator of chromatin subfamily A3
VVSEKIVGVRFYSGHANPQERVHLKREPNNQYDRNAIRVDNVMGAQIGHIPRAMAAKLAPYMVRNNEPIDTETWLTVNNQGCSRSCC